MLAEDIVRRYACAAHPHGHQGTPCYPDGTVCSIRETASEDQFACPCIATTPHCTCDRCIRRGMYGKDWNDRWYERIEEIRAADTKKAEATSL